MRTEEVRQAIESVPETTSDGNGGGNDLGLACETCHSTSVVGPSDVDKASPEIETPQTSMPSEKALPDAVAVEALAAGPGVWLFAIIVKCYTET